MGKSSSCLLGLAVSLFSALIGVFIFLKPALAIEWQRIFYSKINWRIEPISMAREIRNTRVMGLCLFIAGLVAIIYAAIRAIAT